MYDTFPESIEALRRKGRLLADRYRALEKQRDDERRRAADLEQQLEQMRRSMERLEAENEHLRTASIIALTDEQAEKSRKCLAELVWEIDKCIKQLSD